MSQTLRLEKVRVGVRGDEVARRRSERWAAWSFLAAGVAGPLIVPLARALRDQSGFSAMAAAMMAVPVLAAITGLLGFSRARRETAAPGLEAATLAVDGGEIVLTRDAEERRWPLADVEGAWGEPAGHTVVHMKSGEVVVAELDEDGAGRFLSAVGGERAVRLPVGNAMTGVTDLVRVMAPGVAWAPIGIFTLLAAYLFTMLSVGSGVALGEGLLEGNMASLIAAPLIVLISLFGLSSIARLRKRRWVTVGADGIKLEGLFQRKNRDRFIPWTQVERVGRSDQRVVLHLRGGESVDLPEAVGGEALHDRIAAARSRQEDVVPRDDALDRAGRSKEAWREHLEKLAHQGDGYREAHLGTDELVRVVSDGRAPPDRRVGAALLLAREDEPTRRRVRIAIDASADDQLKAALEQALEGEIAEEELAVAEQRAGE
jgi:hypothetical protein